MLTDRAQGLMQFSRLTKYLAIATLVPFAAVLTDGGQMPAATARSVMVPTLTLVLSLIAFGPSWFAWSRTWFRQPVVSAAIITLGDTAVTGLGLAVGALVVPDETVYTASLPVLLMTAPPVLLLLNRYLPHLLAPVIFRGRARQQIMVLGSDAAVRRIQPYLQLAGLLRMETVASDAAPRSLPGIRIFDPDAVPTAADLTSRIALFGVSNQSTPTIDHVLYVEDHHSALDDTSRQLLQQVSTAAGVPLTICTTESNELPWVSPPLRADAPAVSEAPVAPLRNPVNLTLKRCLDILIALPVITLVLPPLCLVVNWIHRRQSPGPLFYRQERCGRNGVHFQILKFRTMHAPAAGATDIEDNPAPRIFELGALLRDTRLDEVPQFINVLLGEMSVVGPRAHHAQDRDHFSARVPHYPLRMQTKPGITGLAQYGEYRGQFERDNVGDRVKCDLHYIADWTLEADLILMVKTARLIGDSLLRAGFQRLPGGRIGDVVPTVQTAVQSPAPADQQAA